MRERFSPRRLIAFFFAVVIASTAAAKTKVACIGDSITYGSGIADRANDSYPAQLQKLLDAKFPGEYEVRNFGNPGRGIYLDSMRGREKRGFRWMNEHKAALAWKPDIVVCNLGINDLGEYIKEFKGGRKRGQFEKDYLMMLADYKKADKGVRFFIWTKLAPLAEGQKFYRSPEPFLMQRDLDAVARRACAVGIDMQEPLREVIDEVLAKDKIHPDAKGAALIAEATFNALTTERPRTGKVYDSAEHHRPGSDKEYWLCAGQSNMQKGWGEFNRSPAEKARVKAELERLSKVKIKFWDFNDGKWTELSPANALRKSAFGVSFAIRRAEKTKKAINILYVAAGGAPAESFLSEATMCAVDAGGKPVYPALAAIATNRRRLDRNGDFPCAWVAREYPRRRGNKSEAYWWPVSAMFDKGVKVIRDKRIPLAGVLWYQGESNATTCVNPDRPTDRAYQEETLRAVIDELRGGKDIPFVMMGLPKMNRPWEQYRDVQKKIAAEKGAIFVDTFAAGLGDPRDVHPRDKVPFAELAIEALERAGK